ncbi:MAG: adenylyltransferase/cytidyltransferase family protein [Sedimentisphaerales bacterium]|nr:adenylyltransferase/cytidyltransferase family protein [Sedimentisphaerales bacterium]
MSKDGKIIVFTPGTWDMFHVGHLNLLKGAKAFGDILIVGIKTDELVYQDKGHHPLMSYADRAAVLQACRYVDLIVPEDKMDREHLLEKIDADILVVGDDWYEKKVRGHDFMVKNNKRVIYLPYTQGRSSSILRKALEQFYKEQKGKEKL